MIVYLLDANVFMEAGRRYYGRDFCPAFWDWIIREHKRGRVFSVYAVKGEIAKGDDWLVDWSDNEAKSLFLLEDEKATNSLREMSIWAKANRRKGQCDDADVRLVAYAHAHGHTVVTMENNLPGGGKIKIPWICKAFGVEYVDSFGMLRRVKAQFVLAS